MLRFNAPTYSLRIALTTARENGDDLGVILNAFGKVRANMRAIADDHNQVATNDDDASSLSLPRNALRMSQPCLQPSSLEIRAWQREDPDGY